jgi:hypothetical protein
LHGVYITHGYGQVADQAAANLETSLGPWVIFGRDGQFVHSCFMCQRPSQRPSQRTSETPFCAADGAAAVGASACSGVAWGIYQVGGGALELLYTDGHSKRIAFSLPLSSAMQAAHPVVNLNGVRYRRRP